MDDDLSFHVLDYIVMALFLIISSAIGVYYGFFKKQTTTEEYLVGGRQLHLLPVSLSLLVTYQSAVSVLGAPAEVYLYNTMNLYMFLAIVMTNVFQAYVIVPLLYPLKLTSTYEYLGRRFDSRSVQLLGTTMGMLQTLLYMCVVLLAPALALESVANIPLWLSVVVVGIIGTIYTSIGGIRTVVWTDVFQCIILFFGLVVILILGTIKAGGVSNIYQVAKDGGRLKFNEVSIDPRVRHSVWSLVIGGFFNWLPNCCNQACVQRICSMKSARDAKISSLINAPMVLFYGAILSVLGVLLYAYFSIEQCDPLANGNIDNPNQYVPYLVMRVFNHVPGLSGLFIAALFSGALSTLSSGINSLSANTIQDVLVNVLKYSTDARKTFVAKAFGHYIIYCTPQMPKRKNLLGPAVNGLPVLAYGAFAIAGAYLAKSISGPVTQAAWVIFGGVGGPLVGIMFLGAIFPHANWIGAFSGGIFGFIINTWVAVGSLIYGLAAPLSSPVPTTRCGILTEVYINGTDTLSTPSVVHSIVDTTAHSVAVEASSYHLPIYDISYMYLGLLGFMATFVLGLVVSVITGRWCGHTAEAEYIIPCLRRFWKIDYKITSISEKEEDLHGADTKL